MTLARGAGAVLIGCAAFGVTGARAQENVVVTGHVVDAETARPLAGADVIVEESGLTARSDRAGAFRLSPLQPGEYMLRVVAPGYQSRRFAVLSSAHATGEANLGEVALARAPAGSATLTGIVWDARTRKAVSSARIEVNGILAATADSTGRFRLTDIAWGAHRVDILRIGYRPAAVDLVALPDGAAEELVIVLEPVPVSLPGVEVTAAEPPVGARLSQFLRRRQRGWGHYFDRDKIERRAPVEVSSLLRTVPGLRVVPVGARNFVTLGAGSFNCGPPLVFLDGARVAGVERRGAAVSIDDLIPVNHVQAIEVYTRATQVPPELNLSGSACGVIVLWTRVGLSR